MDGGAIFGYVVLSFLYLIIALTGANIISGCIEKDFMTFEMPEKSRKRRKWLWRFLLVWVCLPYVNYFLAGLYLAYKVIEWTLLAITPLIKTFAKAFNRRR